MTRDKNLIDWNARCSDSSEDFILRMLCPWSKGKYVEIGVWEPIVMNNSYLFYQMGWDGLLVDPVKEWTDKAKTERKRDTVINKAVSNYNGTGTIKLDAAQTSLEPHWTKHQCKKVDVETIRFEDLINQYPEIRDNCDFCGIDVEGHEKSVIESINFSTFRPSVFFVEAVRWNPFSRVHKDWEHRFLENGYKLICHNMQNRFYGKIEDTVLWEQVAKWNLSEE